MNLPTKLSAVFLLSFIVTYLWASEGTDGVRTALKADDLMVVQAGEKIYQAQCASCHGQYLEGQPDWRIRDANGFLPAPPHDATGHTWPAEQRSWQEEVNGTQQNGLKAPSEKQPSLLDKLLK